MGLLNIHHFADKGPYSQSYGFPSSHVWMWELDHEEGSVPKNWYFWTVVLEKTLESPLDCKETQPVYPKGNQSWIFIRRTDAEAETPILWSPDSKNWLTRKDPDAGKNWRREEKGATGWDGWTASLTRWTWVWVSSGTWWWTGKPGILQSMGSKRVGHDWATELSWAELNWTHRCSAVSDSASLPGSSVPGILQERILEWVAMPSSRISSWRRDRTCASCLSCLGRQILYHLGSLTTHQTCLQSRALAFIEFCHLLLWTVNPCPLVITWLSHSSIFPVPSLRAGPHPLLLWQFLWPNWYQLEVPEKIKCITSYHFA